MIRFAGRGILLDIEGTVSSIRFVYDTMFPYVRTHVAQFLQTCFDDPQVRAICDQVVREATQAGGRVGADPAQSRDALIRRVIESTHQLMDADAKVTGLKQLQGLIWDGAFKSGELKAQLFDDVPARLADWRSRGLDVRIYSSGSVAAQKLFFGYTQFGDLSAYLGGYYDTTTGPKREATSYRKIAGDMRLPAGEVLFLSDVVAELDAAAEAGTETALVSRPGNPPTSGEGRHPEIKSLAEVELA
ncbi:MAG TPA: acireductone synthase [Planctomycetaceae bacterium]|nr:acireductone synthase [Planctomycetaceae bacterium]